VQDRFIPSGASGTSLEHCPGPRVFHGPESLLSGGEWAGPARALHLEIHRWDKSLGGAADPQSVTRVAAGPRRRPFGELMAIAAPSGCGKSTLIKSVAGLYKPSYGNVYIDGQPLSRWNAQSLRSQIALVAQDDSLLQGTLAENISGFDEQIDMARVRECADLAQIKSDIERMPMGYESLVGDMGSTLSGGQKQRVLIARALYRRPRILILDEGTSHLDLENERAVNAALSELAITRLVVAHRPETLRAAGRVITLEGGVAREAGGEFHNQRETVA
jgi:ABC-type bacteriocin/lantibiotic exporter with double-glycine peptidase domain